ncbi:hypothetical protein HYH02_009933 [Chlamydomonas schloesseri]|uniref:Uncharacterized protein n=1 Tax=Chlamydomonas schloesseri TaxID=2026947 RepID=A0A835W6L7_9CHLO|nr:hypothetical protein HYH02_009933 [Chlamydomonas schloesseri]|eukprot:KAG2441340.1 hypothetical protein HYH02_009933 [Chlamydomonas schloesseri]
MHTDTSSGTAARRLSGGGSSSSSSVISEQGSLADVATAMDLERKLQQYAQEARNKTKQVLAAAAVGFRDEISSGSGEDSEEELVDAAAFAADLGLRSGELNDIADAVVASLSEQTAMAAEPQAQSPPAGRPSNSRHTCVAELARHTGSRGASTTSSAGDSTAATAPSTCTAG